MVNLKEKISQEDIMKVLDACYNKCLEGKGKIVPSVDKMADDYLSKEANLEKAVKVMQKY